MRFAAAVLAWLAATVALAVAVPASWAQAHIIDADGYAALAREAAGDPALQSAMASELTTRAVTLIAARAGGRYPVDGSRLRWAASAFTAGPAFPPMFEQANRAVHGWLFTDRGSGDPWTIDVAPMLKDGAIQAQLSRQGVAVPAALRVPVTASLPGSWRQGRLRPFATWGPWVSVGAAVLSGCCALLTLAAARSRGQAISSLGVSALIVGALGWAGTEIGRPYVNDGLDGATTTDLRDIGDVMVTHAEASLHHWLDVTLVAGAALVAVGVVVAVVGGLRRKQGAATSRT
ncbi:hypothetical protein [Mycobacterium sp. Marseille-P9652]|uniref:hypothetical protein n=1 Tax=Mycobacterium sp. Marseille-P9652 TaxID=2654950 RepID=UPI0012E7E4C8|nr:hypothetical protein [Mycobacterium sp. Marseille-P9652]